MQNEEFLTFSSAENDLNNGQSMALESKTGMIFQLADSNISSCCRVAEQLLGYSAKQIVGTTAFTPPWQIIYADGSAVAPEDYPAIVALKSVGQTLF